jgi:hypothetical protein
MLDKRAVANVQARTVSVAADMPFTNETYCTKVINRFVMLNPLPKISTAP